MHTLQKTVGAKGGRRRQRMVAINASGIGIVRDTGGNGGIAPGAVNRLKTFLR